MAETDPKRLMDPKTGFCHQTGTYSSLRRPLPLPPINQPLSVAEFCLSLFQRTSTDGSTTFVVNETAGESLSYSQFVSQVRSLAYSLQQRYSLSQNDVAFVVSPPSIHIPVVYFALLSLGIIVSPSNPLSSNSEIAYQIQLSKSVIAFATSKAFHKIPFLKHGTILLDSPEFLSMLTESNIDNIIKSVKVNQSDTAAILYSSGTTGRVKGVMVTHRNLIGILAIIHRYNMDQGKDNGMPPWRPVTFFTVPLFHAFGFFMLLGMVLSASTVVLVERFDFEEMLRAVEKYKVTAMPVSPPVVVAFVKSGLTKKYNLSSLQRLGCGGASLGEEMAQRFRKKFPNVLLAQTGIYNCLTPTIPLPPISQPLSAAEFCFSIFNSTFTDGATTFSVNTTTGEALSYSQFVSQVRSLAYSLQQRYSLSQHDVAFILSPPSIHVPVVYFALLSLGIVVSPANPLSSKSEIAHQIQLSKPVLAFVTSETSHKIPSLTHGTILLDSPEFLSLLTQSNIVNGLTKSVKVNQSDTAAILYSSGTTGRVKGVMITHRNLIAMMAVIHHQNTNQGQGNEKRPRSVTFFTVPLFHVFGFFMLLAVVLLGNTVVLVERFDFEEMLRAVEKYKVTGMPVSPPLAVAFVKSDLTKKYDLSSLQGLGCGGAPLGKDIAMRFNEKFPGVLLVQGYGLTETSGGATRAIGPEEASRYGSVGRLAENMEGKIVDPETGEALPPGQRGELWLRGPTVMKGDEKATAETLDSEGWLKTGDICYFDSEGFLYVVDRLKELIKYKAYQVPPAELEHLLHSHPEIVDAAVIPYPDEEAGQIPMAYVVRNPGSNITQAQVMDFIAKQVAPYKKIRRVAFINSIPKTPAGKILRRELINHSLSNGLSKL
ncbi:hypothetical protein ES319_A07G060000v1 [Gossypium barbadense]|uniref:4-coumarate--CoA ligase-like 9 n=1 Tax=Gossypium barbadense TaxID=3634 RepID=A0A5J5V0A2_GOSBA|nr:hypothetical protein ES319_A07G060000v1 [Gossypium barbadense]